MFYDIHMKEHTWELKPPHKTEMWVPAAKYRGQGAVPIEG